MQSGSILLGIVTGVSGVFEEDCLTDWSPVVFLCVGLFAVSRKSSANDISVLGNTFSVTIDVLMSDHRD